MKPFSYYKNSQKYPTANDYTTVFVYQTGKVVWEGNLTDYRKVQKSLNDSFPGNVTQKVLDNEKYNQDRSEYWKESKRLDDEFKIDLFKENDVEDNPKAERLLEFCHYRGGGFSNVCELFEELVDLIR